jgi:hypothetical protein
MLALSLNALPILGGLLAAAYGYYRHPYYSALAPIFNFLVGGLLLNEALTFLRKLLRRPRGAKLAFWGYGIAAALFLDLYSMFVTLDLLCQSPHEPTGFLMSLGSPCSGWPVFVDFQYRNWPVYAGLNLLLWVIGTLALSSIWMQFRRRGNPRASTG